MDNDQTLQIRFACLQHALQLFDQQDGEGKGTADVVVGVAKTFEEYVVDGVKPKATPVMLH